MLGERETSGRFRRETKPARDDLRERTLFDAETSGLELGSIPQEGVEHPAEPMGHRDDRGLVAAAGTELQKIRMERMRGSPRVMSGLAEHRPELGRSALGDVSMSITVPRLVRARHEAGITRDVLRTAEALDICEDRHGGERDDGPDAGHRFKPADLVPESAPQIRKQMVEGANLFARLLPDRVVQTRMGLECGLDRERVNQMFPAAGIPQTAPRPNEPTRSAQQALGGLDLCGLNPDEVAAAGQRRSQRTGYDPVPGFEFVTAHQAVHPIATMCRVLGWSWRH